MPIKDGKVATRQDVVEALLEKGFVGAMVDQMEIHTATAATGHERIQGRRLGNKGPNRAYVRLYPGGPIMYTAPSTYKLVEEIQDKPKWAPIREGGLFGPRRKQ